MYVRKRLIIAGTALSASLLALLSPAGPGEATQSVVSTVKARWCFTALPLPARFDGATANDVNNHGVVVGNSGDEWQPTVWRRQGIKRLPGTYSEVLGIDDAGLIVGHDGVWPQIWRRGLVSFLSFPPDFEFGLASAVNDGVIVGEGDDGGTWAVPVVWRDLEPRVLPFRRQLDDAAWARDVNDHGLIVGGKSPAHGPNVAVVWVRGRYHPLPSPHDDLGSWATAVSDTRLIVGGWGSRPAMWKPAPAAGC